MCSDYRRLAIRRCRVCHGHALVLSHIYTTETAQKSLYLYPSLWPLCGTSVADEQRLLRAIVQGFEAIRDSQREAHVRSTMEELGFGGPLRQVSYENTYITSPEEYGPQTKFERHKVYEVLVQMLKAHLEGQQYDPVKSSQISKMLADDLREAVRTSSNSVFLRTQARTAMPSHPDRLHF